MIPRYSRPEMAAIWEPQTRYRNWFEIEAHAADALAELGVVPKEADEAGPAATPVVTGPALDLRALMKGRFNA